MSSVIWRIFQMVIIFLSYTHGGNIDPECPGPLAYYQKLGCKPVYVAATDECPYKFDCDVIENCAPVYYSNQSPQTACSVFSRCQNGNDTIIRNGESESDEESDKCLFGSLVLSLGDELNQSTDYSSVCVKCVCEVPPIPTCQRLPDDECDVTQ